MGQTVEQQKKSQHKLVADSPCMANLLMEILSENDSTPPPSQGPTKRGPNPRQPGQHPGEGDGDAGQSTAHRLGDTRGVIHVAQFHHLPQGDLLLLQRLRGSHGGGGCGRLGGAGTEALDKKLMERFRDKFFLAAPMIIIIVTTRCYTHS